MNIHWLLEGTPHRMSRSLEAEDYEDRVKRCYGSLFPAFSISEPWQKQARDDFDSSWIKCIKTPPRALP
ncbi:hypothetical protein AA0115_g7687 [Alternaria tenuissima]|uniref:Uncharacterized protein n=1 Tax=Alternaria tenuissima TaxID=119927 RepID=A0AB37WC18_9PLEO|nr:hypothetical protein AA0115_g7687 [Alternaria tenuissima]